MSLTLTTARHLANLAPSEAYSANRSRSPSRPSVTVSFSNPANAFAPASTLMPASIPKLFKYAGNGVPSVLDCRMVSSNKITPPIKSAAPSVINNISRYRRLDSSVDSVLIVSNRFFIVGVLSSAAKIPLPFATIAFAVAFNTSRFIKFTPYCYIELGF